MDFSLLLLVPSLGRPPVCGVEAGLLPSYLQPNQLRRGNQGCGGGVGMEGREQPRSYHYHSPPSGRNLVTRTREAGKHYNHLAGSVLSQSLQILLVKEEEEDGYWAMSSGLCHSGLFPEGI